jgi:hypothetical protein
MLPVNRPGNVFSQRLIDRMKGCIFLKRQPYNHHTRKKRIRISVGLPKGIIRFAKVMFIGYSAYAVSYNVQDDSGLEDTDVSYNRAVRFDTNSFPIKIDNCCTQSMSGYTKTKISHQGTIKWNVTDDSGMQHDLYIPNSYLVPNVVYNYYLHNIRLRRQTIMHLRLMAWCATRRDLVVIRW